MKDSIFLDIGSGFGKPVFHVSAQYQVSKSIGIDFFPIYLEKCRQIQEILSNEEHGFNVDSAQFYLGDATSKEFNQIYNEATHIYCYNRVFSETTNDLIFSILKKSSSCKMFICFVKEMEMIRLTGESFRLKGKCSVKTTGGQSFVSYFYVKPEKM